MHTCTLVYITRANSLRLCGETVARHVEIQAVLFDLFDTLLLIKKDKDLYALCLMKLHEFLVSKGIRVSFDAFKHAYFEVVDGLYAEVKESLEEPHFDVRVSRVLQRIGYDFDVSNPMVAEGTRIFAHEFMQYVHLDDEALGVLEKLRGKYKLGLISNFAIPECVWTLLDKFGLTEFFDVILISAEINKRKPSPEVFKKALKTLNVDASRAVFVGDSPNVDIKGAKNAGIRAILVKKQAIERITDLKPNRIMSILRGMLLKRTDNAQPYMIVKSLRDLLVSLENF